MTACARSLGDKFTRLDRFEPDLNEATPGDPGCDAEDDAENCDGPRPDARVARRDHPLAESQQDQRQQIARRAACRLVGDKTGGGGYGSNNDIGVLWPPGRAPVLITSFLTQTSAYLGVRDRAIAGVGKMVAGWVAGGGA